ncbi:metal tolerance protein 1-like [Prosopis cineraria]|uniref:metal tolerance protein 1-like n=1 Tax=Prosopis cineraria TaxID=364024 RepID=UPI00240EBBDD|nr:metal tolerance protein 1-like [Prosopis cineraria]
MEAQSFDHAEIIETRACGEVPCALVDAGSLSRDSIEQSLAMRKLWIAIILTIIFTSVELFGGFKANSLAILTDAAHLLPDVTAFGISLFSLWAAGSDATPRHSYGFFRIEILGALVSIQPTWLLAGFSGTPSHYKNN